jgi:autotransporter-associated beta strand protein
VTVSSLGTLKLNLANGETFSNNVTNNGHIVASPALSNSFTIAGTISGTGNFTKTGGPTVGLTGANTYTGGTTISGGTLLANNPAGSATGSGAVTIAAGGALGGAGAIGGAVVLNSGGTVEPGIASLGTAGTTLHAGAMTWNGGGTLSLQVGASASDELILSGALTKGSAGTFTLNLIDAGVGLTPVTYTLLSFTATTFTLPNFHLVLPSNLTGTIFETPTSLQIQNLVDSSIVPAGSGEDGAVLMVDNATSATTETLPTMDFGALDSTGQTAAGDPVTLELSAGAASPALAPAPEPASGLLLAFGGSLLLGWRRRPGRCALQNRSFK